VTSVNVLEENKPGKVVVILPEQEEVRNLREDVEVTGASLFGPLRTRQMLTVLTTFVSHFRHDRVWVGHSFPEGK
jgi:hypothetical protein